MAVHFPKTHYVIRRDKGAYVGAIWTPSTEAPAAPFLGNIQPASTGDYARAQAIESGRRVSAMMRCITDLGTAFRVAGDDGYPGDIIIYRDQRWLVIGSAIFDSLDDPDTSHRRYMMALEVEAGAGEVTE